MRAVVLYDHCKSIDVNYGIDDDISIKRRKAQYYILS